MAALCAFGTEKARPHELDHPVQSEPKRETVVDKIIVHKSGNVLGMFAFAVAGRNQLIHRIIQLDS